LVVLQYRILILADLLHSRYLAQESLSIGGNNELGSGVEAAVLELSERNLAGNPLLDSNLNWSRTELIADDYRMLFGTAAAQNELAYINPYVPDPRTVVGLKDWFIGYWAVP